MTYHITAGCLRRAQTNRVLAAVEYSEVPCTAAELASRCGIDRLQAMRRLIDLCECGRVHNCGERTCEVTGERAMVWEAV